MIDLIHISNGLTAVLREDSQISRWVEEQGRLDVDRLVETVMPLVKPGDVVVDGGANIGCWTLPFSNAVGASGRVYAFEPMPLTFACLAVNVRALPNVFPFNSALGAKEEAVSMEQDPNAGGSHVNNLSSSAQWRVLSVPLSDFQFERLDMIKLDIEGSELEALRGAKRLLKQFHPKVVCEINRGALQRRCATPEMLIEFMDRCGYRLKLLDPRNSLDLPVVDVIFESR